MNTEREVTMKAASVARACPHEWSELVAALQTHTDHIRDQCIISPLEELARNQGRAQQLTALLALLRECKSKADQYTEKRK